MNRGNPRKDSAFRCCIHWILPQWRSINFDKKIQMKDQTLLSNWKLHDMFCCWPHIIYVTASKISNSQSLLSPPYLTGSCSAAMYLKYPNSNSTYSLGHNNKALSCGVMLGTNPFKKLKQVIWITHER